MNDLTLKRLPYEEKHARNFVTRYLHSTRYRELRSFVDNNASRTLRVLDIGCGPGGAASALSDFPVEYTGIDIREDFINAARARYAADRRFAFHLGNITTDDFDFSEYDLIIALETFEHIPEGMLVRVIERIAAGKPAYLICSVPIEIGPSVAIKNLGSFLMGYDRRSGNFRQTIQAATYRLNRLPPHGTFHLGFNWIWLEQTLRHNLRIIEARSLPHPLIPKWLAPSVMFICEPY